MYEALVARVRYHIQKANFMGLKDAESTLLLGEAADAIDELLPFKKQVEKGMGLLDKADELLNAVKSRWIPVTERLPKADEYDARGYAVPYLVMNGWMRVTARRTKDYWVLFGQGTVLEYVTHWMPLPQPPKEET